MGSEEFSHFFVFFRFSSLFRFFFVFLRFFSFFFAFLRFLCFSPLLLEQAQTTAIYWENVEFHSDPVCTDPVRNFPIFFWCIPCPLFFFPILKGANSFPRHLRTCGTEEPPCLPCLGVRALAAVATEASNGKIVKKSFQRACLPAIYPLISCAPKLPESRSERILFHGQPNLSPIFREISCAHFSWKLKDENRRKFSPYFLRVLHLCGRKISPEFRSRGFSA